MTFQVGVSFIIACAGGFLFSLGSVVSAGTSAVIIVVGFVVLVGIMAGALPPGRNLWGIMAVFCVGFLALLVFAVGVGAGLVNVAGLTVFVDGALSFWRHCRGLLRE